MESLRWFKFDTKLWTAGRISMEDYDVQGVFLACCILYWDREGEVQMKHLRRKVNADEQIDLLMSIGLLHDREGMVYIKWIDEEIESANARRNRSRKGAAARWNNAKEMLKHKTSNAKGDAKTKEKKTKDVFRRPTREQVIEYFKENEYGQDLGTQFFLYYDSQGWVKSNGIAIKNWKSTAQTWFRKEEKKPSKYNLLNGKS